MIRELDLDERDALTGLINGDGAIKDIARWQSLGTPGRPAPIHAMLLTIKRFSAVNLAYGAAAGDAALATIAGRILKFARGELGEQWTVARIRGGTFLIATNDDCTRDRWQWLAEELALTIAQPITDVSGKTEVRLWPRLALLRALEGEAPGRMLSRLGEALESGRHNPGERFCWVEGDVALAGKPAQQLEADLIAALDRDEIEILFQPQFACDSGAIVGAEALTRWQHPELGRIGAVALFAIAARADHIGQLSRRIAGNALAQAATWPDHLRLSLNITSADLASRDFADAMAQTLLDSSFPPERLTLEITEQALLAQLDQAADRLARLADLGVHIALDDFGAGFCNFRYLKILPLDALKLDRSMIDGIADDPRDLAVLRAILAMAKALDLEVIAEGVETEAQRDAIIHEGCAVWQGFLGAEPMTSAEFIALVS